MRRLILLRHAKSSWDRADLSDATRPLNKRGERAAPLIGHHLAAKDRPDCILCSTAKRATQTARYILEAFDKQPPYHEIEELYMATPREILAVVADQRDDAKTILVIGHNPGLGDLADWLVAEGDIHDINRLKEKFPTAAYAVIDLPIDHWQDLRDTGIDLWNGRLVRFVKPRDLDADATDD